MSPSPSRRMSLQRGDVLHVLVQPDFLVKSVSEPHMGAGVLGEDQARLESRDAPTAESPRHVNKTSTGRCPQTDWVEILLQDRGEQPDRDRVMVTRGVTLAAHFAIAYAGTR
jgi:hypothetical protein